VFLSTDEGQALTFTRTAGGSVDTQTSSRWDIFGTAVDGSLRGARLEAIVHANTFWFAWTAFAPSTTVVP
jgi:hypothetical protein